MKTSWEHTWLSVAEAIAHRATCLRRKYGAVIVKDNKIISTGYCGAPSGMPECTEIMRCWREDNRIPSGSNYEKCFSVHAEQNALLQAGDKADGAIVYIYGETPDGTPISEAKIGETIYPSVIPCFLCTKMMINAGIRSVACSGSGAIDLYSYKSYSLSYLYEEYEKSLFYV